MCTVHGELTEMAWLSLFGEKGAWSEIVWFVAQAHTLKGGHRTWSCCKDRLMETTAVSLVETETAWNSHSVCDHVISSLQCHCSSRSPSCTWSAGASGSASPFIPMPPFQTPRRGKVIGSPGVPCLL